MGAGKIVDRWYLAGHSQVVISLWGFPSNWVTAFDIHCSFDYGVGGSPARMGLQLPPGAEKDWAHPDTPVTYVVLVQNTGDHDGLYDILYQYQSL